MLTAKTTLQIPTEDDEQLYLGGCGNEYFSGINIS
jgi:hypothetical protein